MPEEILDFISQCPVCGDGGCDKTVKYVNSVYVHEEDVIAAERIRRPAEDLEGQDD